MRGFDVPSRFNTLTCIWRVLFSGITHKIAKDTTIQSLPENVDPLPHREKIGWTSPKIDIDTCEPSGPGKGVGFKIELRHQDQLLESISRS